MRSKVLPLVMFALLTAPLTASAGLLGSDVAVNYYFPNLGSFFCSNGTQTVGAGVEYATSCGGFGPVSIDVSDDQIVVDTGGAPWSGGAFNGFVLDVVSGPDILSAVYGGGSMGVTSLNVVGGLLQVNFAGQTGGRAVIDFQTAAVPEPVTLSLLGLGVAGLSLRRRRR